MTASSDDGTKACASLKGTALWFVAAVMLVFHGVAAGLVHRPLPGSEATGLGTAAIQPGALPRDVPKSFHDNKVSQKTRPSPWLADDPPHAFVVASAAAFSVVADVAGTPRTDDVGRRPSSFPYQSRAPPSLGV